MPAPDRPGWWWWRPTRGDWHTVHITTGKFPRIGPAGCFEPDDPARQYLYARFYGPSPPPVCNQGVNYRNHQGGKYIVGGEWGPRIDPPEANMTAVQCESGIQINPPPKETT